MCDGLPCLVVSWTCVLAIPGNEIGNQPSLHPHVKIYFTTRYSSVRLLHRTGCFGCPYRERSWLNAFWKALTSLPAVIFLRRGVMRFASGARK